ncbi:MAG: hypothetical protein Q7U53_15565 [Anaerolineaceae bacterium]|nr:hypothetical protein [Anaerolineaceae bacterium]
MKKTLLVLFFVLLLMLSACTEKTITPSEPKIDFFPQILSTENNEVVIILQMVSSDQEVPADPNFNAIMKLSESNGDLRAEAVLNENPAMTPGTIYEPIHWSGLLEPGVYQLEWSAPGYGGTINTFEVVPLDSGKISIGDQKITPLTNN